jgi:hypothetical protein
MNWRKQGLITSDLKEAWTRIAQDFHELQINPISGLWKRFCTRNSTFFQSSIDTYIRMVQKWTIIINGD